MFNLCAVVDSTSKLIYPSEKNSRKRFIDYIDANQNDLLFIYMNGVNFIFDGFWGIGENRRIKISEILYEIRCCNYHDPEELKNYITIENSISGFGLNKIDKKAAYSLFLILFTDQNNKERIDRKLFESVGKVEKNKLIDLIGERQKFLEIFKNNKR